MKTLIVDKKYDGKKLNTFLLDNFSCLNVNTIYKALRKKDVRINGVRVNSNVVLHLNDEVIIYISDNLLYNSSISYDVVYEDDNILILNKPVGIEVTGNNSLSRNFVKTIFIL